MRNLVLNALAYAPAGSEVRLDLSVGSTTLTLEVQDQGPGVPEARRATIFEGDSTLPLEPLGAVRKPAALADEPRRGVEHGHRGRLTPQLSAASRQLPEQ